MIKTLLTMEEIDRLLDDLTSDIKNAKKKARSWLRIALAHCLLKHCDWMSKEESIIHVGRWARKG